MNLALHGIPPGAPLARVRPASTLVLLVGLLASGATGCFKVSQTAAGLRDVVADAAALEIDRRIECRVGFITTCLVRGVLCLVDVDAEARTVCQALRGAEVGIYSLRGQPDDRSAVLGRVEEAMAGRGWQRIVAVLNPTELVAVFVPDEVRTPRNVAVCVLVLNEREMIVAGARGDLEPLVELAMNQAHGRDSMGHRSR